MADPRFHEEVEVIRAEVLAGLPHGFLGRRGGVSTGVIAGLMAQGLPAFEAACAGVWIHAEAGAAVGPGLIAEDLPEQLPAILRALLGRSGGPPA